MNLRRLNEAGLERMAAFLDSQSADKCDDYPVEILTSLETSEELVVLIEVDSERHFPRRFEAAEYLYRQLRPMRERAEHLERDRGVWAWLALLWFDQLCPPDNRGRRKVGVRAQWIPELQNAWRYYRHLVLGPYLILRAHAEYGRLVEPVLCDPVHVSTSEHFRTVVETQQFVTSRAVIGAIGRLYYDPAKGRLVRGAGTKGAGGVRRLGNVLAQLDRTFDLHSLDAESLLGLLPREFKEVSRRVRVA